jgi:hypothetical protein
VSSILLPFLGARRRKANTQPGANPPSASSASRGRIVVVLNATLLRKCHFITRGLSSGLYHAGGTGLSMFPKPPDRVELFVGVYFGQPRPRCDSDAVPPKTVQVICLHPVQKSYRTLQVETSHQNAHGSFHGKTTQFLAVESLFRFIPRIGVGRRTPKADALLLWTWHCEC